MYLFFLIFFIFVSVSLVFLVLFQPVKGFNNTIHLSSKSNTKFFNNISTNNFITNIIAFFSFLFLVISIILCNINSSKTDSDFFLENSTKQDISLLNEKQINSDIPN